MSVTTKAKFTTKIRERLIAAGPRTLVKFHRPFDNGAPTEGYVLQIGPEYFLLLLIGEDIRLNGFQCIRLQDVRKLQIPTKYSEFIESALRLRGQAIERKPRVKFGTVKEILQSAHKIFPLLTIHCEKADPDTCHIGRVVDVDDKYVSLLEIGPDAIWEKKPESYRLRDITKIDFGGDYEEALVLVGGLPLKKPSKKKQKTLNTQDTMVSEIQLI